MFEFNPIPLADYLDYARRSREFGFNKFFSLDPNLEKLAEWVQSEYGTFERLAQVNHNGSDAQFVEFSIIPTNPARLILTLAETHGIEIESELSGDQFRVIQNEYWENPWHATIKFLSFNWVKEYLTDEFDKVMKKYDFVFSE